MKIIGGWRQRIGNYAKIHKNDGAATGRFSKVFLGFLKMRRALRFQWHCLIYPVNPRIVVFEAFLGNSYACSPKAIYERMLEDERYRDYQFVWSVHHVNQFAFLKNNPRTVVVKKLSQEYYRYCAEAKYWINNATLNDALKPRKGQVVIQTWHGTPLKRLGCDIESGEDAQYTKEQNQKRYKEHINKLTYFLSPSAFASEKFCSAFAMKEAGKEHIIRETGYPRNDFLYRYTQEDVKEIKKRLHIPEGRKVILYAPTWRDNQFGTYIKDNKEQTGYLYKMGVDLKKLVQDLGGEYIILVRVHVNVRDAQGIPEDPQIIDVTDVPDINELYVVSDMQITDYSSTLFDYANLKRPILFYMYDLEEYGGKLRGFYLDLAELPGPIIQKEEELAGAIKDLSAHFSYDEKYQAFNRKYNYLDGPDCSRKVLDELMPPEYAPPRPNLWCREIGLLLKTLRKSAGILKRGMKWIGFAVPAAGRGMGICVSENSRKLKSYKGKYQGKRCFLVGNGPSLSVDDLDRIADEYSFGCNMIYKIFSQTRWRPSFHCMVDAMFGRELAEEFAQNVKSDFFTSMSTYHKMEVKPANTTYAYGYKQSDYTVSRNFLSYYIPSGSTVMTYMIELAMFMGFEDIYLIGVDCTSSLAKDGHCIPDYASPQVAKNDLNRIRKRLNDPSLTMDDVAQYYQDRSMFCYRQLKAAADKKGVRIFNATRGGMLEVYPRRQLEEILGENR